MALNANAVSASAGGRLNLATGLPRFVLQVSSDHDPRYRIAVLDDSGAHMFWASESLARDLIRERKVTLIRSRNRTVALQALPGAPEQILELAGRRNALGGTRYTHHNETPDNPQGVWAYHRLMRDPWLYNGVLASLAPMAWRHP